MFGADVQMMPEAKGNRMTSKLDATKSKAIGWTAQRKVADYIKAIRESKR